MASKSIADLIPATQSLLLVIVTTGIVVALGLLLNILVERPLLKFSRRLGGLRPPPARRTRSTLAINADGYLPAVPTNQPQFQIGPIGVRVQHGPKLPPL